MPPIGGGLMQLVAYGAQDAYLTGSPQITFFEVTSKQHTNFASVSMEFKFGDEIEEEIKIQIIKYQFKNGQIIQIENDDNTIIKIPNKDDCNCCICLEDYGENDELEVLECGHHLHKDCCEEWLENNNSCPLCRGGYS